MINALFLLGSSLNKNRKVSLVFMIVWLAYIFTNQSYLGVFPILNAMVFMVVTLCIGFVKNRTANTLLSVFSILIWSILIDIICYYVYPMFLPNQSIFGYIWQGIVFNYKYVFFNIAAICVIYEADMIVGKVKMSSKLKEKATA